MEFQVALCKLQLLAQKWSIKANRNNICWHSALQLAFTQINSTNHTQVIQSDNRYRQEPIGSVSDSNRNPMKPDGNLINRQNPIGFLVAIRHLDPWGRI